MANVKWYESAQNLIAKRMAKYIPNSGDAFDYAAGRLVYEYTQHYTEGDLQRIASYAAKDATQDEVIGIMAYDFAMSLCDVASVPANVDRNAARVEVGVSLLHKRPTRKWNKRTRKWERKVTMAQYAYIPLAAVKYNGVKVAPFAKVARFNGKPMPWGNTLEKDTVSLTEFFKYVHRVYRNAHFPYSVPGANSQWQAKLVIKRSVA